DVMDGMADANCRDGHGTDRVLDLIAGYGPGPGTLGRAGTALMSDAAGVGVSAGAAGQPPRTLFTSDDASNQLETAQARFGEGPCRHAAAGDAPAHAAEL